MAMIEIKTTAAAKDTADMVEEAVVTAGTVTDLIIIPTTMVVEPMPILVAATAMSMRPAPGGMDRTINPNSPTT